MSGTELRQRLSAILAADAAGYSRLMAADDRATVAALDAARAVFRSRIEANQGRVIDMAGDSVLAVFETATGAVSAALSVQERLGALIANLPEERRMRFRIGVHLGDVIEKPDGTVYGDGVNIAARLQALAEPGGITISESVQVAVRSRIVATFAYKGKSPDVRKVAQELGARCVDTVFDAIYVHGRNLGDMKVVVDTLNEAGLDADAYLQAIERPDIKQKLLDSTQDAVARRVFGVPTFFVDEELFFGQDRLEFVVEALERRRNPAGGASPRR